MRWPLWLLLFFVLTNMVMDFFMWADIAIVNHNVGLIYEMLPGGEDV